MASLTGKTLGKYQLSERLGRGGMAEVYKAYHPQLERYAAIKVLHGFLAEGRDFQKRFQREAKAIAALRHPNIVQIYDIDAHDESYYMVMEFIDGGTLKDRLLQANGPLPIAEMAHIFREIASALDYAHQQGVLHRDVKPANVLLDKSGRSVLTDFGIARIISDTQFTATGTLVGTPAYMSPEQGKGMPIASTSDIYSLGIILYEMVTGKVPFDADTPLGVIHKHINEPLPPPRSLREDIPKALEDVILKALAKDADNRYSSAAEMMEAANQAFRTFEKITLSETIVEEPDVQAGELTPEDTIASKETMAMPPEDTITSKATVAMEPESDAEADIADKATVAMNQQPDTIAEPPVETPAKVSSPPKLEKSSSFKPLPTILSIVAALIVVVGLVWGLPLLTAEGDPGVPEEAPVEEIVVEEPQPVEGDCSTPEECHALAEERWGNDDLEGVLIALEQAVSLVPETERQTYAPYWCMRAEALVALNRIDEAIWNFEDCLDWAGDNPDLEDLRVFAQEQINIHSGSSGEVTGETNPDAECTTPEECHAKGEELWGNGDLGGAIGYMEQALQFVPEDAHPQYHFIMCAMGELFLQMEDFEEALARFTECMLWTEDDPGLEEVRTYAQEQIDMINNR